MGDKTPATTTQNQINAGTTSGTTSGTQTGQTSGTQNQTTTGLTTGSTNQATTGATTGQQLGTVSSTTNPWSPATGLLQSLIDQYSGINAGVTPDQQAAIGNLTSSVSSLPNYGGAGAGVVDKLLGTSVTPQIGMLNTAYNSLNSNIGGDASGANLNPYATPGFADALDTMTNDITNKVKGTYAASGRSPSGAGSFAGSLARGLTQGEAPIIASQFNTNKQNQLNAANTLYGAGNTTAGNITSTNQVPLTNAVQGLGAAGMLPSLYSSPATAQLGAANTAQSLPINNLNAILQAAGILGKSGSTTSGTTLGQTAGTTAGSTTGTTQQQTQQIMDAISQALSSGTTSGTSSGVSNSTSSGTGTQTPANDPLSNWIGGISAGAGLLGAFSDERLKEDIKPVGKLFDGQDVFSYRMKGDNVPQIGLLAQRVEKAVPEAVGERSGFKTVRYDIATRKAAKMGMLSAKRAA